jgi:hypothetical protein
MESEAARVLKHEQLIKREEKKGREIVRCNKNYFALKEAFKVYQWRRTVTRGALET